MAEGASGLVYERDCCASFRRDSPPRCGAIFERMLTIQHTCRRSYVRSRYPSPVTASPTWPFRAHYAGRSTYVTRRGQRRAAIVPADAAEAIERAEDAADVAAAREALARVDAGDTRSP